LGSKIRKWRCQSVLGRQSLYKGEKQRNGTMDIPSQATEQLDGDERDKRPNDGINRKMGEDYGSGIYQLIEGYKRTKTTMDKRHRDGIELLR
jgi:hypothetical protein